MTPCAEQVELLKSLGAEHVLNISDDSFRGAFGALAEQLGGTLAFDAVGSDTTKSLMLGMPAKSRICVYGALGGGAVDVMLAAGDVVVDFALVDDAVACLAALKFKRFCGAQLSVEFLEGNRE